MQIWVAEHCITGQAVLFDLDGTLVRSTGGIEQILKQWAKDNDLSVDAVLAFSHGKRTQDIVMHFLPEAWQLHYAQLTDAFIAAADQAVAMPDAAEFIQQLNAKKIPWAVVSSSERVLIEARMQAAGLPIPLDCVAAEDIEKGKPDPEGYLKGAQKLGIEISQCLVFEDSNAGLEAGRASGAQVIAIQHHNWQPCIERYSDIRWG